MCQRTLSRKWKNPQNGRKYLQIIYLLRMYYPEYIKNTIRRQPNWKMDKGFEWTFLQRRYTKVHENIQTSLVSRKTQIESTMRNHFTPTRMSTGREKWAMTSVVQDIRKSELSPTADGNVKWLESTLAVPQKVIRRVTVWPARFIRKRKHRFTKMCTWVLIAAWFLVAKKENKCPSADEWINKMCLSIQWNLSWP